jgi:UDP-2,3-diacylglucosamine pyrophosphatase LpxH
LPRLRGRTLCCSPSTRHDSLRRKLELKMGNVQVVEEAYHQAADGKTYLVLHGDRYLTATNRIN